MTDSFKTLRVTLREPLLEVVLDRPERANALTSLMITELHAALDLAETDPAVRILALSGEGEAFCAGMDFVEVTAQGSGTAALEPAVSAFYSVMERFTLSRLVIVVLVSGRVTAGGTGLVAAADYVIAGPNATFQLSEVIFGLLPATVAPFIIRRCGFQAAYRLALTARRIDAANALAIGLTDETSETLADALRQFLIRASRLQPACIVALKGLFRDMWIINSDTRRLAIDAIINQISRPETIEGIRAFVQNASPPWKR